MPERPDFVPESDPEFIADYMKGSLIADVFMAMEENALNKSQLADRLGKSRQYVGRVLNETANFTIDSIATIAAALEMDVVLRLKKPTDVAIIKPYSDWILEQQTVRLDLSISFLDDWHASSIAAFANNEYALEWKNAVSGSPSFRINTDQPVGIAQSVSEQLEMVS
jgi:transcriptional regulator with XRE-family HTH domain